MTCDQAQRWFEAYLDGELPSSMDAAFRTHSRGCPECRRELALMELAWEVVAAEPTESSVGLSPDFTERLMACLPVAAKAEVLRSSTIRMASLWAAGLAAAAVFAIAFVGPLLMSPKIVLPTDVNPNLTPPDQSLKIDRFNPEVWLHPFNLDQPFPKPGFAPPSKPSGGSLTGAVASPAEKDSEAVPAVPLP